MNWIKIKDELPPLLTEVLVVVRDDVDGRKYSHLNYYSSMKIAYLYERMLSEFTETENSKKDILRWNISYLMEQVIYWMPLPDQPERSKREDSQKCEMRCSEHCGNTVRDK